MHRIGRLWLFVAIAGGALGLGGCNDPLFPKDAARSPYERYQVLRGQYRAEMEYDALGRPRPALRARLQPLQ